MDYGKDTKKFCTYNNASGAIFVTQGMYTYEEAVLLLEELTQTIKDVEEKWYFNG